MNTSLLITGLILIATIGANFFVAYIIFRSNFKPAINRILAVHIVGIGGWAFFILLNIWSPVFTGKWAYDPGDLGYWFEKLMYANSIISLGSIYWFVQFFSKKRIRTVFNYSAMVFQIAVLGACFVDNLFFGRIIITPHGQALVERHPAGIIVTIFFLSHLIVSLVSLLRSGKKEAARVKKAQIKVLSFFFCISFSLAMMINWILPVYFGIYQFNPFGPTISLFLLSGIIYAITRYDFLDIKSVIQRGLIYAALLSLVVIFYWSIIVFLGIIFQKTTSAMIIFSAGLTSVLGIFGVPPIERWFRQLTDRIFFKDKYDYSQALEELSEILNKNIDLKEITVKTLAQLQKIFKVRGLAIAIAGERHVQGDMRGEAEMEVFIPIEGSIAASISLNGKLSGDSYTEEDMKLLRTFAHQFSVALEKSFFYNEVKKHADELEQRVAERTAEIKQLQEEQKLMALEISHGLQTPLTIIKGELNMLERQMPENDKLFAFEKSIDKITKFIYDLLSLARLETGQDNFKMAKFDLSESLAGLVEYYEVMAQANDIKINSHIEPAIFVLGNKEKIEEMITNIVSNSVKYIANNREISINLKCVADTAELMIEDAGIGIAAEELPFLFDKFHRSNNEKARQVKGTGLGLAITKKIAEKHGGNIRIESELGKGTKVFIVLSRL